MRAKVLYISSSSSLRCSEKLSCLNINVGCGTLKNGSTWNR